LIPIYDKEEGGAADGMHAAEQRYGQIKREKRKEHGGTLNCLDKEGEGKNSGGAP